MRRLVLSTERCITFASRSIMKRARTASTARRRLASMWQSSSLDLGDSRMPASTQKRPSITSSGWVTARQRNSKILSSYSRRSGGPYSREISAMSNDRFSGRPVRDALPPMAAGVKLREVGENAIAAILEEAASRAPSTFRAGSDWWPFRDRVWQHTAHAFGFLRAQGGAASIQPVGAIDADSSLKNGRIKISLNRLRVADYPGSGTHRILFDFYARNQVPGFGEDLHFNAPYRVRPRERAPIAGY